jgi:hypothetical protein
MVMATNLRAAHTGEKFLRPIRASAVEALGLAALELDGVALEEI